MAAFKNIAVLDTTESHQTLPASTSTHFLLFHKSLKMPKAEKGTPKDLANRMKSKGLQKLAFYCQVCEKQMRDQNGFKQHCASEPHVRMMLLVGQNPSRAISDYSRQFKHDFLQLLRTAHGEKRVHANQFYQEYIQNKQHIHMNGTHWKTLTEFVKGLGREGICRVDEGERGLFVAWIDNSPEALNRQAAIKRKDKQDKGDEERANQLIAEQIERAHEANTTPIIDTLTDTSAVNARKPDEKVKIALKFKTSETPGELSANADTGTALPANTETSSVKKPNVFNALRKASAPKTVASSNVFVKRPLSNAEQIVQEERDRKRRAEERKKAIEQRQQNSGIY